MIVCDREHLGLVDVVCRRNAFGRQIASFEADLELDGIGPEPLRAVFIRAPWVETESIGEGGRGPGRGRGPPGRRSPGSGLCCARFIPSSPTTRAFTHC